MIRALIWSYVISSKADAQANKIHIVARAIGPATKKPNANCFAMMCGLIRLEGWW